MSERPAAPIETITERQLEVARLVEAGRTNPEIAEDLGITLAGAKYHVSELLGRLGLERREEIAAWYREQYSLRRRLRAAIGLPIAAIVGGAAAVAGVAAIIVTFVMLNGAWQSNAVTVATIVDVIDTDQGRWEILNPPPAPLRQHFAIALDDGRVLFGGVPIDPTAEPWTITSEPPQVAVWLLDLDAETYTAAGDYETSHPHAFPTHLHADQRADGTVVILGARNGELTTWHPHRTGFNLIQGYRHRSFAHIGLTSDDRLILVSVLPVTTHADTHRFRVTEYDDNAARFEMIAEIELATLTDDTYGAAPLHTAAVIDQQVILVSNGGAVAAIDIATGDASVTNDAIEQPLVHADAVVLDDGRVLLSGGFSADDWIAYHEVLNQEQADHEALDEFDATNEAVIIDPLDGQAVEVAPLPAARALHTSALLDDGRVLLVDGDQRGGGVRPPGDRPPPAIYDPATDAYSELAAAPYILRGSTATVLEDGSVLLFGSMDDRARALRFLPAPP